MLSPPMEEQQKKYNNIHQYKNITGKRYWGGKGNEVPEDYRDICGNMNIKKLTKSGWS